MGTCYFCGKEVDMPFKCSYCNLTFCSEHRIPEKHNCISLTEKKPDEWKKLKEMKGLQPTTSRKSMLERAEYTKREKKISYKFLLVAILLAIIVSSTTSYLVGNSQGFRTGYVEGDGLGYNRGYNLGFVKGFNTTGYNIRDPTYQEAIDFIYQDQTDKNTYIESDYVCHDFSYDVKRNAFKAGFHCLYVVIEFPDYSGHTIVAFNTTDRGLLFIEPQWDKIVTVELGLPYMTTNNFPKPSYDDTITKIELVP